MTNFEALDMKEQSDIPEPAVGIMSKLEELDDAVDQSTFMDTDDATFTEQIPEPDSDKIEPEAIDDSVDVVSADLSAPDVNEVPEEEVLISTESALPNNNELDSLELDETAIVDQNEHENSYQRSLSSCDIAEDDGVFCEPSSDHCTRELEMDNGDLTVTFNPDYIVYRDSYCTDCVLTFTSSYIKIEGSSLNEDDKIINQWSVQDVVDIKSHWYDLVQMVMVTIHVLNEDTMQPENVECTSGAELKFVIMGAHWYEKQEEIITLNVAYKSLWNSMLELDDTVLGQNQSPLTKYFPNFDQPFEEVIYPKGDVDAVSISKRDVDLLLPDTFVNDTIIDFYIKYLKNKISPEDRQRFHFFNSFFFRKLADPDKDPLDALEGKTAFQRVKKWTRKVNLFEKDFVFIPINYNYHWSLIVMCHLGEIATYKDEDVTELTKVPCVLHMDSIRGTHTGFKRLMQSYLKEEWISKQQEGSEDISSRFDKLRFISLELPQQPNSFDCGLFLLHYVELFLEQAPINFNPFKITKSVNFLSTDWFSPAEASLKRVVVQRLVYDLLHQPYNEPPSMAANNNVTAVNFFTDMCSPSTNCQTSQANNGIEMSLLPSLTNEQCHVDPIIKPQFESRSFLEMRFPSFNETSFDGYKSLIPPIEEEETGGEFGYDMGIGIGIGIGQENGIAYSSHQNDLGMSPETSVSGCEDSLELEVINERTGIDEEIEFKEIGDGMEPVELVDGIGDADADLGFSLHRSELELNGSSGSGESSGMESDVQNPAKRIRMMEGSSCN